MCVAPQKSVWATKRFNIVDALESVYKHGDRRRLRKSTKEKRTTEEPKYLLRVPCMVGTSPRLREIIDALLMTHRELCQSTGIHHSTMSRIISGKHFPTKKHADMIASAVNRALAERGIEENYTSDDIWPGVPLMRRG